MNVKLPPTSRPNCGIIHMSMSFKALHYSKFLYFYSIFFIVVVYFIIVFNVSSLLLHIFIFEFNLCSFVVYSVRFRSIFDHLYSILFCTFLFYMFSFQFYYYQNFVV